MADAYLVKAYKTVLGQDPVDLEEWEIARDVVAHYDGRTLTQDFWQEVLFVIINHIHYPSVEVTQAIVGAAEDLYSELMGIEDEPHMAAVQADEFSKRAATGSRR